MHPQVQHMTICLFVMPTIRMQTSDEISYKIFSGFVTPNPRFVLMANFVIALKNWNFLTKYLAADNTYFKAVCVSCFSSL